MEHFSSNGFRLAKVELEIKSLWEAMSGFSSQSHAQGTWAHIVPQRVGRSGKLHLFPKFSYFLASFALSWLLLKPYYNFKALSLSTSYEVLSSHLKFCMSSLHDQRSVHSTKAITG